MCQVGLRDLPSSLAGWDSNFSLLIFLFCQCVITSLLSCTPKGQLSCFRFPESNQNRFLDSDGSQLSGQKDLRDWLYKKELPYVVATSDLNSVVVLHFHQLLSIVMPRKIEG